MTKLSVLDLMMIGEDKGFADTLAEARMLARHVEKHGYERYWIAEHHDLPGIASSATTLLISDLAAATSTLRVGAGGIMLPNHSPLMVAEQFATLATLYPGRIDLGLGRAAGAAGPTIRALRGDASERDFEQDIRVLSDYLQNNGRQPVRGIPGKHDIPLWILGSSMNSADLAARLGLPYSFASHFAPHFLKDAVAHYRANFKPSAVLDQPYVIAGINVFAADTEQDAQYHASSHFHWVNMLYRGRPGPLPLPQEDYLQRISASERNALQQATAYTAMGDVDQVGEWLRRFIAISEADELIIDARIHDPAARCRSYQLAAEALSS
ncbi:LLM class flavin-dependent oxidoreductase [Pseudomonas sp. OIL-1]|uniref:LLM class flavin-dependent oxidoreductase n=1 Tax=Pseudomonas sp. OIL-1 TaxID=2706126 RepID=UPI0013A73115|nr:LLM class flavin-dependent oxidoreductase [Pseudomonas sp. OIL-1]QIB52316.1 LLM class flavin-dependent oxidoreductase [Pseudomonas sp. OIL-1]